VRHVGQDPVQRGVDAGGERPSRLRGSARTSTRSRAATAWAVCSAPRGLGMG